LQLAIPRGTTNFWHIIVPTAQTFSECAGSAIFYRDSDYPLFPCEFVEVDEIKHVVHECIPLLDERERGTVAQAQNRLSAISQLPIWSPFFDFDFCGCLHGIFWSCPIERLHAWQTGIMKGGMQKLFLLGDLPSNFMR
jgi:hypothetical protein